MNAGAHGHSMGEVRALGRPRWTLAGAEERVPRAAIAFAYRSARLPRPGFIVAAGLRLRLGAEPAVLAENKRCLEEHKRRLPFGWGSAGSVFKNPPGDAPGGSSTRRGSRGPASAAPRSRPSTRT